MLKGGFGPEVLAFSSELNRNSTGPPVRGNRVNDKVSFFLTTFRTTISAWAPIQPKIRQYLMSNTCPL